MNKWEDKFDDLKIKLDEAIKILDQKLKNGEISKYEYNELKTLDFDLCIDDKDPIKLFKEFYLERKPIKCSELLLVIYDEHETSFRKAVLLSECFPDPLGYKYNQDIHEFSILIITRAFNLAKEKEYPSDFLKELQELYLAFTFFNHNNMRNTEKLNKCEFMKFTLSEQIRMLFIFLQDQSRLVQDLKDKDIKKQGFFTGMESAVSNNTPNNNPNMLVSFEDNFEGIVEAFDILIRYLYSKKKKDFEIVTKPEHGDITHIEVPSLELITHLSVQRNLLIKTWEKFKYSQWNVVLDKNEIQETYVFMPKNQNEYKQHIIASNRRQYLLMIEIFKMKTSGEALKKNATISHISKEINKDDILTLFSINESDYFKAVESYKPLINAYSTNMHKHYFDLTIDGVKLEQLFKVIELLYVLAECYTRNIYGNFKQEDETWYKYLCPIVSINYLIDCLTRYYGYSKIESLKLINYFTFKPGIKGESDIFSRPLICVNPEHIVFSSALIQQMNIERIVEMLLSNYEVNIAKIGTDFENEIKFVLRHFSGIKVNTNKIDFVASDGKDIEFDFIGTFDNHLLLWEFKAMTVPYSDKRHLECKKTIKQAVDQIERRCRILRTDWDKIKTLVNIDLPDDPFEDDKIVKLACTNIFDFTNLIYGEGIRIVDKSTLLKFFVNPVVKVMNVHDKKVLNTKKLWKGSSPTINEFKLYLENPITTSPYNECLEAFPKVFEIFEDDYPYAIIDQILTKNPYGQEIEKAFNSETRPLAIKPFQRKKGSKKKRKKKK